MTTYQCKCGNCVAWSSMGMQDCQGCDDCGTTYAAHPDDLREKIPHDWAPFYNSRTGEADRRICNRCHTIERLDNLPNSIS